MTRFLVVALMMMLPHLSAQAQEFTPELDDLMSPDEIAEELRSEDPTLTEEPSTQPLASPAVVVKINKASNVQTMWVYVNGRHTYTWPVSTGREKWENPPSGRRYYSSTPVGTWTPYVMRRNHYSNTWKVSMPYSIFLTGGIAIHAAARQYESKLGSRASGGCIRLREDNARTLFHLVEDHGRKATRVQIFND